VKNGSGSGGDKEEQGPKMNYSRVVWTSRQYEKKSQGCGLEEKNKLEKKKQLVRVGQMVPK